MSYDIRNVTSKKKVNEPEIVEYLQNDVPSKSELKNILTQLGLSLLTSYYAKDELAYQQAGLNDASTEDEILNAMDGISNI